MNDNPSCQHFHIDHTTGRCVRCDERMLSVQVGRMTVLSAPNIAPCRDPNHLAAIAAGEDFECHHPYVPGPAREVAVGYTSTYECARCVNNGNLYTEDEVIWDCGHSHIGDIVKSHRTTT